PMDPGAFVVTRGQPLSKVTTYKINGRSIELKANDDVLKILIRFEFDIEPMSINRADDIIALRFAEDVPFGEHTYSVFTETGLSRKQTALITDTAFLAFVEGVAPCRKESIHVYGNGLAIYLSQPSDRRAVAVIDLALATLGRFVSGKQEVDLKDLPAQFLPL